MSFERRRLSRDIDCYLGRARNLRSAYLLACLTAIVARFLGTRRHRGSLPLEAGSRRADEPKVVILHTAN